MVAPAGFLVPTDQGGIIRIQEVQFVRYAALVQLVQDPVQILEEFAAPDIHHQSQLSPAVLVLQAQFYEFGIIGRRKIGLAKIALIFQGPHDLRLPRPGHPCNQ